MNNTVKQYVHENFRSSAGDAAVRDFETLCETLGYGRGFMQGRALEEFLADNPGAVESLLEWVERISGVHTDWEQRLQSALSETD